MERGKLKSYAHFSRALPTQKSFPLSAESLYAVRGLHSYVLVKPEALLLPLDTV
ncbi:hypothetical protein MHA01_26900 [Marinococcus halophilus]|uniref:Uncharacterized protein n=1 Tax=Marinococcus halophilus TaxID=1371 RepID=A0A510Y8V0_MARHA|nr:hypothetical protein MHA01_26900 [Marinococcus halophilus]